MALLGMYMGCLLFKTRRLTAKDAKDAKGKTRFAGYFFVAFMFPSCPLCGRGSNSGISLGV
jgi:hypothetical protein